MEIIEDVVIAGAGLAGLTTALGLHRLGIRCLVLESSEKLRATGFAISTWSNAWKALDAVGVGDTLRQQHKLLPRVVVRSWVSGEITSTLSYEEHEVRCLKRRALVEALEKELPNGTLRYSSKVVAIEESDRFKLVHVADGTIIKTKVLIGCDGVNSVVGKWLGLDPPVYAGRSCIRAYMDVENGHGFGEDFVRFSGNGFRLGFIPCDDQTVYWFLNYTPSSQDKELEENPAKLKQFALSSLENLPDKYKYIVENTRLENIMTSPMRYRKPWNLVWGNISKGNVCVSGDSLHPMTPETGQGGNSALEDGVVLARCLAEAFSKSGEEEWKRIEKGLEKYAKERRWRSVELIFKAYAIGRIQQNRGKIIEFLRDRFLNKAFAGLTFRSALFDCGKLAAS